MQANRSLSPIVQPPTSRTANRSWKKAYFRFLLSKDENLALKAAPLAILGLLPVDVLSNIIPIVGELDDIGFIIALAVIIARTLSRVCQYR